MTKSKEIIRQKLTKSKEIISILAYNIFIPGIEAGRGKKEICISRPLFYISLYSTIASKQGQDLWTLGKSR